VERSGKDDMAVVALDETDAAIIALLQEDGRMSAVDIAERLAGVTPRVVRHRIKKLVRHGVISVIAVVHAPAMGYDIRADVSVQAEQAAIPDAARRLAELDLVTYVAFATGETDIRSAVVAKSVEDLHELVQGLVRDIPSITRTRTFVLGPQLKFTHAWRVPEEVYAPKEPDSVSQKDGDEAESP
jgi:DNA-binding Lrp family transcriptional regulator